jgi:hypothetical protein
VYIVCAVGNSSLSNKHYKQEVDMKIEFRLKGKQLSVARSLVAAVSKGDVKGWADTLLRFSRESGFSARTTCPTGGRSDHGKNDIWAGNLIGSRPVVPGEARGRLDFQGDKLIFYGDRAFLWDQGFSVVLLSILGKADSSKFHPETYQTANTRLKWDADVPSIGSQDKVPAWTRQNGMDATRASTQFGPRGASIYNAYAPQSGLRNVA